MGIFDQIKTEATGPCRFIGRVGSSCRRCRGVAFYVNRANGVACIVCDPPQARDTGALRLTLSNGKWIDADNGFETPATPDLLAGMIPVATRATPAPKSGPTLSRFEQDRLYRIERAWHAFADDFRDWGWITGAEFLEFNRWAMAHAENMKGCDDVRRSSRRR
jgi:hypothetical protein